MLQARRVNNNKNTSHPAKASLREATDQSSSSQEVFVRTTAVDGALTLPIGEKPDLSRKVLSAKLIKSCGTDGCNVEVETECECERDRWCQTQPALCARAFFRYGTIGEEVNGRHVGNKESTQHAVS